MLRRWIVFIGVISILVLVNFWMECWSYNGGEHAAINEWVWINSVGFDFAGM